MLSIPSSFPGRDALLAQAIAAHEQLEGHARGALLRVHATAPVADCLGWTSLDGAHPVDALLGFVAPDDWRAIGVCTTGRAHSPRGTEDVAVTLLVDRAGATASVLRRGGGALEVLPGRPDGMIADACRRALGLPTAPPPGTSLVLWTLTWLDRVVVEAHDGVPGQPTSWAAVARLHPASGGPRDPVGLAFDAVALGEAWPWGRLRAEPSLADLPGSPPSLAVAHWMDDGMWARWVMRDLPPAAEMLEATRALLPRVVADAIALVVAAASDHERTSPDEWDAWRSILVEDGP